ncbi:MAG: SLATT domain-containing protein [Mesorhizobium sp.]
MIDWQTYPDLKRMWSTRGSRFACHQRLARKNVWISYTISLAATYVIILSILEPIGLHFFNERGSKIIVLISVFISIVIIFLSLIEGPKNSLVKGEALHASAREINRIYHTAEQKVKSASDSRQPVDISGEVAAYDESVRRCEYNHDSLDYRSFVADNLSDFPKFKEIKYFVFRTRFMLFLDQCGAFSICLVGIPMLLIIIYVEFHA